jgi:hypothetical protein
MTQWQMADAKQKSTQILSAGNCSTRLEQRVAREDDKQSLISVDALQGNRLKGFCCRIPWLGGMLSSVSVTVVRPTLIHRVAVTRPRSDARCAASCASRSRQADSRAERR